jgi:ribulose-5-phosphate 4-epimerase/fuculose-1-phosphate aldolase
MHSQQRLNAITKHFSAPKRTEQENKLRVELAAAYRLAHLYGWDELTFNHISVKLDDDGSGKHQFLINPYGLGFDEVTASSLVKIDIAGNVLDPGDATGRVNPAGFVIHGAVHEARPNVCCVLHTHQADVTAVACRKEGLLPLTQTRQLLGKVTYHEYEGIAVNDAERASLARDLGQESMVMLLRNHGCLTLGKTVGEAVVRHFFLVRACETQLKALGGVGVSGVSFPAEKVQEVVTTQLRQFNMSSNAGSLGYGQEAFQWMMRNLERKIGTDWKN